MWQLETAYKISNDGTKNRVVWDSYMDIQIRNRCRPLQQVKEWDWSGAPYNCGTNSIFALRKASPLTGGWGVAKYRNLHSH